MRKSFLILHFTFCICLATACYDNAAPPSARDDQTAPATITLGELNTLCPDYAYPITQPIVVSGVVTSSDEAGNFYNSFTLQDETGGAELMCGIYDLYRDYPPGMRISVRLEGLAIGKRLGVVQIGFMPPTGDYAVDYIASKALLDRYVACGTVGIPPEARLLTIPELSPGLCGTLVSVENLTLIDEERMWEGIRTFADPDGNELRVNTSVYTRYAPSEIPRGTLRLTGILQEGTGGRYALKMRDESDCTI